MRTALLALSLGAPAAALAQPLAIEAVSAPPSLVTGDRVLVRIVGEGAAHAELRLDGRPAAGELRPAPDGRGRLLLLEGLKPGRRVLVAATPGRPSLTLTVHAADAPMVSGPRQSPFYCQTEAFRLPDGQTLGPSTGPDCWAPTTVRYVYRRQGEAGLSPLADASVTPADADRVRTLDGRDVPFLVRVETGVINRGVYQFAVLHEPAVDGPLSPHTPPRGWARRLIALHGSGCTGGWYVQGDRLGGEVVDLDRLAEGYALFANTLNHPTNSCNPVVAAETTIRTRQRVIEALGPPLYTLTMGGSGGAYTSLQVADLVPGVFDGALISSTFPDALAIATQGLDARLLARYFRETAPGAFTPDQQQAVAGFGVPAGLVAVGNQAGRTDPAPDRRDAPGYRSAVFRDAVPPEARYHPTENRKGARPTVFDAAADLYGRDPSTGFARRPYDNVGVQYGLGALNAGQIGWEQFLDLNARIGGYDADANYAPGRSVGDPAAIAAAYEKGLMLSGAGGLRDLAVLDYGGLYTDLDAEGEYHLKHHHFAVRERLARWGGAPDLHVMWSGGVGLAARRAETPDPADAALSRVMADEGLRMLDRWLTAAAVDGEGSRAERLLRHRPQDLRDGCWTRAANPVFIMERQVAYAGGRCETLYPTFRHPRLVAGGPLAADILKCTLKPVDLRDYLEPPTAGQLARLREVFPHGVCDWTKPGVHQAPVRPLIDDVGD